MGKRRKQNRTVFARRENRGPVNGHHVIRQEKQPLEPQSFRRSRGGKNMEVLHDFIRRIGTAHEGPALPWREGEQCAGRSRG